MVWFVEKNHYQSEKMLGMLLALALGYYSKNENIQFSDFCIDLQDLIFKIFRNYNIQIVEIIFDSSVNILPPDQIGKIENLLKDLQNITWDEINNLDDLENLYNTRGKEERNLLSYNLKIKIDYNLDEIRTKIFDDLLKYAELYVEGKLVNLSKNITLYKKEKNSLLYNLNNAYEEYGNNLLLDTYLLEGLLSDPFQEDDRLFIHHFLGLLLENYILEIKNVEIEQYGYFKFLVLLNEEKLNRRDEQKDELKNIKKVSNGKEDRIRIIINDYEGIYLESDPTCCYPILRKSQGFKFINELRKENQIWENLAVFIGEGSSLLLSSLKNGRYDNRVAGVIRKTNILFRNKLGLDYDLIVSVPTGGYKLNEKKYKIKFKK